MTQTIVFVLDVSGSMYGHPSESLQLQVWREINDAPDNQRMGVVLFDDQAWIAHPVVQVNSQNARAKLKKAVPKMDRGGTDIGKGLRQGLKALQDVSANTEGAVIFLVTDGEDFNQNYVDQILPDLQADKIVVSCVAIGPGPGDDTKLEILVNSTGGTITYVSDIGANTKEMAERAMSAAMAEVVINREMAEVVLISVYNDIVTVDEGNDQMIVRVHMDQDIGAKTRLKVLSHDIDSLIVTAKSPSGRPIDQFDIDLILKRARLIVNQCEPGVWTISLTKQPGVRRKVIKAQIVVESEPTANATAIELYVGIRGPEKTVPPIIVCRLDKGLELVMSAKLMARVDRPDGTYVDMPLNRYHTDGYYYNYFTDYCGSGRYNVSVIALNDGLNTICNDTRVGEFRRQRVAHSFQLKELTQHLPPDNRVIDQLVGNGAFAKLTRKTIVQFNDCHVQEEIVEGQNNQLIITEEMATLRRQVSIEYTKLTKAIKHSKLHIDQKRAKFNELADFEDYLTSRGNTTQIEIDRYRKRLTDMWNTL